MTALIKRNKIGFLLKLTLISAVLLALVLCVACARMNTPAETDYGVFLGVNAEQINLLKGYGTVVIDAVYFTREEIEMIHQNGAKKIYSYLNIGSIETFREGYDSVSDCILSEYENWPGEYWVDVSRTEWQIYIEQSAKALAGKGVDGFFLDNADVYYLYPGKEIYDGLVSIIAMLNTYDKDILINGGDSFVSEAVLNRGFPQIQITGVNQECVFTNINFANRTLVLQDADTSQYYRDYLASCKAKGLKVYLLEYAKDGNSVEEKISAYCNKEGFVYYRSPSIDLVG